MSQTLARIEREKKDGLTERQRNFCRLFVDLGCSYDTAGTAAVEAGYAASDSLGAGRRLLAMPHVRAEIHRLQTGRLSAMASQAIDVINEIMMDPDADHKVRLEAAKAVLDRAGIVALREPAKLLGLGEDDKRVSEMTREELRTLLEQAKRDMLQASGGEVIDGERLPDDDSL